MAESKSLAKFEFMINPEDSAWQQLTAMTHKFQGWTAGKQDYYCWLKGVGAENVQFVAVYEKETMTLVAGTIGITYPSINGSPHMSSIGHYFVHPDYRGIGLGLAMFDRLVKSKQFAGKNQLLASVPEMSAKYAEKYGFKKIQDWEISTYFIETDSLDIHGIKVEDPNSDTKFLCPQEDEKSVPWDKVFEYDRKFYGGVRRDNFVRCLLTLGNNSVTKIAYDNRTRKVVGIGSFRETFDDRLLIGPLYADTPILAHQLLYELLQVNANYESKLTSNQLANYKSLCFNTCSTNQDALDLLKKLGKYNCREVPRVGYSCVQFTDYVINVPANKLYSVSDFIAHIA